MYICLLGTNSVHIESERPSQMSNHRDHVQSITSERHSAVESEERDAMLEHK